MGLLYRIVVGFIVGWFAEMLMKRPGHGILVDVALGMFGGLAGGWFFSVAGVWPDEGIVGSTIIAFVGAFLLLWGARMLKKA